MNKQMERLIDAENRLMVARGEVGWGTGRKGEGINKYKLVVTNNHGDESKA